MNKKCSVSDGVTLVSLIVAILLMLILAGITLRLAFENSGIISKAINSSEKWEDISKNEDEDIKKLANKMKENKENQNIEPEEPIIKEKDADKFKAGDYIIYNSKLGNITCRILYEANSEYGLQIVSDKNAKNVTLGSTNFSEALNSYNNAIETLNNESMKYLNTDYTLDARCIGSNPTDKTIEENVYYEKNTTIPAKIGDDNSSKDVTQMKSIGILKSNDVYWLASRWFLPKVKVGESSYYEYFYMRLIYPNYDETQYQIMFRIMSNTTLTDDVCYKATYGLRPCLKLNSDVIKITGGDGTVQNPYTIGT